ncbi:MAG: hypothetical protein JSU66_12165 [Deltaproteobacteria bacterium]|nr:MAG: hypothetical protein JSU66_12165 [Deltaproteobacteria bacterium]
MRRVTTCVVSAVLAFGLAGSAAALSITDDLSFVFTGVNPPISGEVVVLEVEPDRLEVKVNYDQRTVSGFGILVADGLGNVKVASGAGSTDLKDGADVKDIVFLDSGEVDFSFGNFPETDPKMSDPVFLEFGGLVGGEPNGKGAFPGELLEIGDEVWFRIFTGVAKGQAGKGGDTGGRVDISVHGTIVPEASTAVLLGFGLVGLAVYGFRRR